MVEERRLGDRVVELVIYLILAFLAIMCLMPFIHVWAKSLSSKGAVQSNMVGLWPVDFTWSSYQYVLQDKQFVASFFVSVARVVLGVIVSLALITITAYPLSRDHIHMPGRTAFKVIMLIGMMFSGGLIPMFLSIRNLGLQNNFLVLIIPPALNIFYTIVLMNYFRGIPREMEEAALLDGASHLDVLTRIFLPIASPALATITLFSAVQHWNSWFDGILYLNKREMWPLQSLLYSVVSTRQIVWESAGANAQKFLQSSPESLQAALILFASVPILCVYPFLQRYFVMGLTLGSVKE